MLLSASSQKGDDLEEGVTSEGEAHSTTPGAPPFAVLPWLCPIQTLC